MGGTLDKRSGYVRKRYRGKLWYVHRLVWTLANGEIPAGYEIDHIDGNRSNNELSNLRLATRGQNAQNSLQHRNREARNVFKTVSGWNVAIQADGVVYNKHFKYKSEAVVHAAEKRAELHGEFDVGLRV